MLGCFLGEVWDRHRDHAQHLLLVAAKRAADRQAVDVGGGYVLRRLTALVFIDAALDDPEHCLAPRARLIVPA